MSRAAGLPAYTLPPTGGPIGSPTGGPIGSPASGLSGSPASGPSGSPASGPSGGAASRPSGGPAGGPPAGGPPANPGWNRPSGTYGVGAPDGHRQPFGGPVAPAGSPPAHHAEPDSGAPPQRTGGTVYGGYQSAIDMTMPVSMSSVENSGSLTGHILAQGWDRGVDTNRRSNLKVAVAMLLVLVFLVGVSVLFLFTAGESFSEMLNEVFNKG